MGNVKILMVQALLLSIEIHSTASWNLSFIKDIFVTRHSSVEAFHTEPVSSKSTHLEKIPDTKATVGRFFRCQIPEGLFKTTVDYASITEADKNSLPNWLYFNKTSNTLMGVPSVEDSGAVIIEINIIRDNKSKYKTTDVSTHFTLDVIPLDDTYLFWSQSSAALKFNTASTSTTQQLSTICSWEESAFQAILVLDSSLLELKAKQRVGLLRKLSRFISIPITKITLGIRKSTAVSKLLKRHVAAAGPGNANVTADKPGIELSWMLGCSEKFSQFEDFSLVIEHNINSGRITEELGYRVIGWQVVETPPPQTVKRLRRKRQVMGTVLTTPTIMQSTPALSVPSVEPVTSYISTSQDDSLDVSGRSDSSMYINSQSSAIEASASVEASVSLTSFDFSSDFGVPHSSVSVVSTTKYSGFSLSMESDYIAKETDSVDMPFTSEIYSEDPVVDSTNDFDFSSLIVPTPTLPWPSSEMKSISISLFNDDSVSSTIPNATFSQQVNFSSVPTLFIPISTGSYVPSVVDSMSGMVSLDESSTNILGTSAVVAESSEQSDTQLMETPSVVLYNSSVNYFTSEEMSTATYAPSRSTVSIDDRIVSVDMNSSQIPYVEFSSEVKATSSLLSNLLGESVELQTESLSSEVKDFSIPTETFSSVLPTKEFLISSHETSSLVSDKKMVSVSNFSSDTDFILEASVSETLSDLSLGSGLTTTTLPSEIFEDASLTSVLVLPSDHLSSALLSSVTLTDQNISEVFTSELYSDYLSSVSMLEGRTSLQSEISSPLLSTSSIANYTLTGPMKTTRLPPIPSFVFTSFQDQVYASAGNEGSANVESDTFVTNSLETDFILPESSHSDPSASVDTRFSSISQFQSTSMKTMPLISLEPVTYETVDYSTPPVTDSSSVIEVSYSQGTESTSPTTDSLKPINTQPFLLNPVDSIQTFLGQYFQFPIPSDTFYDIQDGTTGNLSLFFFGIDQSVLGSDSWIQFDEARQVIYGIPLQKDLTTGLHEYILLAKDSAGLSSDRDAITASINTSLSKKPNHYFKVTFDMDYESFISDTNNVVDAVLHIGRYFGEDKASSVLVSDIQNGSVVLTWMNGTLSRDVCDNVTISTIYEKLSGGGRIHPQFRTAMWPKFPVKSVGVEYVGNCLLGLPMATDPTTVIKAAVADSNDDLLLWILIPTAIVVLIILVIAVILCYIRRKRRYSGKAMLGDEKPIFTNNRNPVLLENELQMRDLNQIPKRPVVLNRDLEPSVRPTVPPGEDAARPKPPPYYYPDDFDPNFDDFESPPPSYRGSPPDGVPCARRPPEYKLPPPYSVHINPVFPYRGSSDA